MPIIASALILIKANKDHTIDIIRDEINRCGCLSVEMLAIRVNKPADELKHILRSLTETGKVSCNSDFTICCADKEKLTSFSEKLKKLRSR